MPAELRPALLPGLVLGLFAIACGDMSTAGPAIPIGDVGELTIHGVDSGSRGACIRDRSQRIAEAYRNNELPALRVRVDADHPRFRALAEDSERAELRLDDGTTLYLSLSGRAAAAVTPDRTHRLLEIPASISLSDCR